MIFAGVTEVVISFLQPAFLEVQNKIIFVIELFDIQLLSETTDYMRPWKAKRTLTVIRSNG